MDCYCTFHVSIKDKFNWVALLICAPMEKKNKNVISGPDWKNFSSTQQIKKCLSISLKMLSQRAFISTLANLLPLEAVSQQFFSAISLYWLHIYAYWLYMCSKMWHQRLNASSVKIVGMIVSVDCVNCVMHWINNSDKTKNMLHSTVHILLTLHNTTTTLTTL